MKQKSVWMISPVVILLMVLLCLFCGITYFTDRQALYPLLVVTAAAIAFTLFWMMRLKQDIYRHFDKLSRSLESAGSDVLSGFVLPLLVCRENQIVWYNDAFRENVLHGQELYGEPVTSVMDEEALAALEQDRRADMEFGGRQYAVFDSISEVGDVKQYIYYFLDQTKLISKARDYDLSRPAVLYILIDNLDQLIKGAKDSERTALTGTIQRTVEQWAAKSGGLFQRIGSDRYMMLVEDDKLERMIEDRFSILNEVKKLDLGSRGVATLTIGVSRRAASFSEGADAAGQALDMALGRGGDQAAVKTGDGFTFFGGTSEGVERSTRVHTRVIATALMNLIEGSDNVLLMGHRFADLDSFGACFGLCSAVRNLGKPAWIVMNKAQSLAGPVVKRLELAGIHDMIIEKGEALERMTRKTLLIITDTHRADFVDSREVYDHASTVVVIDHHRKNVGFIDNAVIFYHETYASSACELVAELLQYMGKDPVGKLEAEAMLAGIMLDTRSFVLRTGVKTFEASAYLRSRGADPVAVKTLFSNSMETYRARASMVSTAEIYGDCAIAKTESTAREIRIASAQAADELLTIVGVNASYTVFPTATGVNISARSLGAINVQLVMEVLGGGGNLTMAACQLEGITIDEAVEKLKAAIDQVKMSYLSQP